MINKKQSPWETLRPLLKKLGYTDEQIDEMTLAELYEIAGQKQ